MSTAFYLSYAALWVLLILHSLLLLGVVRMVYRLQQPGAAAGSGDTGLKPGQTAPAFSAVDVAGIPISSGDFAGRLTALMFVSPNCPSCTATLAEMEALRHKARGNVVVICRAGREECAELAATHKLSVRTVADGDDRISGLFRVSSNPTAVLIDERGHIQSYGHPMRGEELEAMVDQARATEAVEVA